MGTEAYSKDLIIRVIHAMKSGMSQRGASRLFSVSKSAVNRWWNRYINEGSLKAKPKLGSKGKVDAKNLEKFVNENPNKNLKEIGQYFNVSAPAIYKRLKSLGFRYKRYLLKIESILTKAG